METRRKFVEEYKKTRRSTDDVRSGNEVVSKGMGYG